MGPLKAQRKRKKRHFVFGTHCLTWSNQWCYIRWQAETSQVLMGRRGARHGDLCCRCNVHRLMSFKWRWHILAQRDTSDGEFTKFNYPAGNEGTAAAAAVLQHLLHFLMKKMVNIAAFAGTELWQTLSICLHKSVCAFVSFPRGVDAS